MFQQSLQNVPEQRQVYICQCYIINVMGPFYWWGEGEQGQILGYHPMTYCAAVCNLRQHLKDPLLSFPHEGKLIL